MRIEDISGKKFGLLGRFFRRKSGVTSVEMAMLALPFLTILFAIIETGYMFFLAIMLEGATGDAARQIRTGSVQQSGSPLVQFQAVLCDRLFGMIQCPAKVVVDVRNYSRFDAANPPAMAGNQAGSTFAPGNPGDVIVVRVAYTWNFITPLLSNALANADGGTRTFVASAAFRNEPYAGPLN